MCGIAGIVRAGASEGALLEDVRRMGPGILSRGPDGVGTLLAPHVALMNTRLAIIDLVGGHQPVWNETEDVGAVFNGEIFNYRELQKKLRSVGHSLQTQTDTEVLVHLYEDHGAEFTAHLHGMYAFAIYDAPRGKVLLARDPLGIKPLYVAYIAGGIAFASSISSLLSLGISRDPDIVGLSQYFRFYKVPEPRTAYRSVSTLLPGEMLEVDVKTGTVTRLGHTRRYLSALTPTGRDPRIAESEAREALRRAVRSHMVADVEVAAFLSGGIDSSLVVAEAQAIVGHPIRTFSFSFPGHDSYDERKYAEFVAKILGSHHETIEGCAVSVDLLYGALAASTQPFAVASFLPMLELSKQAATQVKVVLTGDGGDEVGLGYPWYRWCRYALSGDPSWVRQLVASSVLEPLERHSALRSRLRPIRRVAKFARGLLVGGAEASDIWRYDSSAAEATRLLAPQHRVLVDRQICSSPTKAMWLENLDPISALQAADLQVLLRDEMMPKLDRAGMAYGLEGRVPLLDDDFVTSMLGVPVATHLAHAGGKALLRRWAQDAVPGVDFERPKHGFDVPIRAWLQGELSSEVQRALLEPASHRLVDHQGAYGVWRRMNAGVPGAAHTLYALLLAELWYEKNYS